MARALAWIACLAWMTGAQAQDSLVQPYGRLNVSVERVNSGASRMVRLSNNRSVFGLRGSEPLGNGVTILYQVEGTVSPDTGGGAFAARDTRLGVQGRWGSLFGGNWSTPYNSASAGLDPFYPTTAGYMSIMGNGAASNSSNLEDTASFDRRQKNSVHYWSPAWRGWTLRLAHGLGEERPAGGARPSLHSLALLYQKSGYTLGLARERHHHYQGAGLDDVGAKLAASVQLGATRLALVAEKLSYADRRLQRRAVYLSASYQHGAHGLRMGIARGGSGRGAPGMQVGFIRAGPDTGALHGTFGYEYHLSRRSTLYSYYTRLHNEARGTTGFAINALPVQAGARLSGAAFGLRHGF